MDETSIVIASKLCGLFAAAGFLYWLSWTVFRLKRDVSLYKFKMSLLQEEEKSYRDDLNIRVTVLETRVEDMSYEPTPRHMWSWHNDRAQSFTHPVPPPVAPERKKPGRKPGTKNKLKVIEEVMALN